MDILNLLDALTQIPALSGHEDALIRYMRKQFMKHTPAVTTDAVGNVIAKIEGERSDSAMLIFAHMDELGLVVRKIEEDGFIRIERVGGVPEKTLLGTWIEIHTDRGERIPGLVGTTSHHVTPAENKFLVPSRLDMYIDVGCSSAAEVAALGIQVGDGITYAHTFKELAGGRVAGKTLDNRIGCALLLTTLEALAARKPPGDVYIVASVQEEFNVRGIWPVFQRVSPDAAICLDVTIACDTPELRHLSNMRVGGGPAIGLFEFHGRGTLGGLIPNPFLRRFIEGVAQDLNIPLQREVLLGIITDASFSQLMGESGVAMAALAVPIRYTHAPVELCAVNDILQAAELLRGIVGRFDHTVDLRRGT